MYYVCLCVCTCFVSSQKSSHVNIAETVTSATNEYGMFIDEHFIDSKIHEHRESGNHE